MKIELLLTGNELMTGDIVDSNSAMIAQRCLDLGFSIQRKTTLNDNQAQLAQQIQSLSQSCDVLIVNGGLGPTRDDLTAAALAQAAGLDLEEHPQAVAEIKAWGARRNIKQLSPSNFKQALLPKGCELLSNRHGSAPGFCISLNQALIICTPGVPSELKNMLDDHILARLQELSPNEDTFLVKRIHLFGIGESNVQSLCEQHLPPLPAGLDLGFRAGAPCLEVKLQGYLSQKSELEQYWQQLSCLLADYDIGTEKDLQHNLVQLLTEHNLQFTTAESCTGGLIAQQLTQVAGASQVFEAGFISYSNRIKTQVLNVDPKVFIEHGAVSEICAKQMLNGALQVSGADIGVAVSGIAGPDGGTDEKPVGTVYIAWGDQQTVHSCCLYYPVSRRLFQTMVAAAAIDLCRRFILKQAMAPYIKQRQPPAGA